jgi:hypothetical protein
MLPELLAVSPINEEQMKHPIIITALGRTTNKRNIAPRWFQVSGDIGGTWAPATVISLINLPRHYILK